MSPANCLVTQPVFQIFDLKKYLSYQQEILNSQNYYYYYFFFFGSNLVYTAIGFDIKLYSVVFHHIRAPLGEQFCIKWWEKVTTDNFDQKAIFHCFNKIQYF